MAWHREPLDGGLWTAADPAMLEEGQLSAARNLLYLPGVKAIQRAPGRTAFGTVSATATAVVGLRDIQFDTSDHYLVALAGNKYRYATVGDTGTFADLATLSTTPTQLEAAHFRNRFYLFNGASASASAIGTNVVAYLTATSAGQTPSTRQHGMLPVIAAPTITTAGGGTFPLTVTGYYEYWTTEVAKLTQDGTEFVMESAFSGTPTTQMVSATSVVPTVSMPAIRNSITTHWRVYRSTKKDKPTDKVFPIGYMILESTTATAQQSDTPSGTNTSLVFPSQANATIFANAVNPGNVYADDGTNATLAGGPVNGSQAWYGFSFGGFSGTVVGITFEIQAYVSVGSAPCAVTVRLYSRRSGESPVGKTSSKSGLITSTNSGAPTTLTLGSATDRWTPLDGAPFADTDFGTDFTVVVENTSTGKTLAIDYIRMRVYYGASSESVIPFPSVVYTFGDVSVQVAKNGTPPSSTTGDFYEDSLVVNDVSNSALIRYSYPGDPDAFPETYFLDFETRENDQVRCIKVINDNLMVWLDSSTHRVNYLPSERDASFDRGKATKAVSSTYGCIDPMCVCVFYPDGEAGKAAFVSHHGIHATDGYSFDTYTDGLDWRALMSTTSTPIALVNDRERQVLLFYFKNPSDYGSETTLCLPLSYGQGHWNGRPKVGGLIHMRNHSGGQFADLESAWCVQRVNGSVSTYLGYSGTASVGGGKVYIESGADMPALDPRISYTTRTMYLADFGNEWTLDTLYGYAHGYGATTPAISYTVKTTKTNDTGITTKGSKSVTLGGQALHKAGDFHQACEGAQIAMVATASALMEEFLLIGGTDFGEEDSGR